MKDTAKNAAKDATYTIKCTHKQLRILEESLELHARLCLGQIWIVSEFLDRKFWDKCKEQGKNHWDFKQKYCDPWAQELFGFHPGASYGVGSPDFPESGQIAYEMEKLMQNTISKAEKHEGYSVWNNPPLRFSHEPFIEVKQNDHGEKWGPVLGFAERPDGSVYEYSDQFTAKSAKATRATKRIRPDSGSNRRKKRNGKQKPPAD